METNTSQSTQKKDESKYKKCIQCNKRRKPLDESHKICQICYKSNILYKPSGSESVDDFIRNAHINLGQKSNMIEFVPYDQFKDIKFIAKLGYYEATWIDGYIQHWNLKKMELKRSGPKTVVLKKLNNSENVNELNEVYIFFFNQIINIYNMIKNAY